MGGFRARAEVVTSMDCSQGADQNVELLRDALDHITRVAGSARQPTRCLNWLAARARMALRGIAWTKDYLPWPKGERNERVRELNLALRTIIEAYALGDDEALENAIDKAKNDFSNLVPQGINRRLT